MNKGTPRLYIVASPDEMELPLFCSESQQEVADFLGIKKRTLIKQLSFNRTGKSVLRGINYKLFELEMDKEELKEVTE